MNINLQLSTADNKFIINNIYPLYLHDLSEIWGNKPNRFGIYEDNDMMTLTEQNTVFDIWWEKPSILFPFLITVDDVPAGLAFVATPPYIPCPPNINYYLNEFFLLRPFRGSGVGEEAARQVFNRFRGNWEVQTAKMERNVRAQMFWRKTLNAYTNGQYSEVSGEYPDAEDKIIFRFTN
ncbi:GNAT family N-acetyltransferase [Paenibacillus sp. FSL W7-1287]|uniref:GNAT family N-acetyltransferase n=1 Tax=Paenibacillus sp. FSL W7-1287 TaxID=2954538 RepID=UPI0030FC429A